MGLPAAQQRVLDAIEVTLRASEPRLAGMFSVFTRLAKSEGRPRREQLPYDRGWRSWLAGVRYSIAARHVVRVSRRRRPSRPSPGLMRLRLLMLGQLMAILVLLGLFVGIAAGMSSTGCFAPVGVHGTVPVTRLAMCRAQASRAIEPGPAR